ncbi:MAG: universal stress protein [Halobacteriaceae archaeon]
MRVLLGVGGTDDSIRALDRTVARAREAGDDLVVAVLDNPDSDRSVETVLSLVQSTLADADLPADIRRLSGEAGPRLVELAARGDYDQIVLGGGQRSPMGKLTVGPIAEYVLLNGDATVTLVR